MYTKEANVLANSTTMTIRLASEVKEKLERLARATGRSKSFLAADAIELYLSTQAWQIEETRKALEEADAGDFAPDAEVAKVFSKWSHAD